MTKRLQLDVRMSTQHAKPSSIDDYIVAQAPEVQAILRKMRSMIRRVAPMANETISYGIPAFALNGILIYFAAFKHHIGLYPPVRGANESLMKRKAKFEGPKGNLIFPLDRPIPYALIARIVKLRYGKIWPKLSARGLRSRRAEDPECTGALELQTVK